MSQKASRKGMVNDEKEKTDTPVKDMKKKLAANAEKEKQAEKKDTEKSVEKPTEKNEKPAEKSTSKSERADKDKTERAAERRAEKTEKKAEPPVEKKEDSKDDKSGKSEKPEPKKADPKPKHNGKDARVNGNGATNGAPTDDNGTVSAPDDDDDDDVVMVIDEHEHDDMFPELTYDDTSDPEFEPPTPEAVGSRSFTRRSQAKVTRTPETPRPASDKQGERDADDSKILKLKDDAHSTDRKLRSSDSPKPEKKESRKDSPKKEIETKDQDEKENGEKIEADVVIEIDGGDDEPRKTDTNYSKSRVKVSPYRRSIRIADQTTSSMMANYTGNNTTMEMDITETTSSFVSEDPSLDDSSYLSGLRAIRGRRSYKPLKEMTLRYKPSARSVNVSNVSASEQPSRPTAPVVGRKRKPEGSESVVEVGVEAAAGLDAGLDALAHARGGKRMRLLDRITHSFRRTASSTPIPVRRAAEIVGINTDLPLSAPALAADPEALKPDADPAPAPRAPLAPLAVSSPPVPVATVLVESDRDNKKCIVM